MRIAYICCDPGIPVFGTKGASVHIQEVVRELRAAGHEVVLYALRSGEHVPADLADLELHLEAVTDVSPAEREQAQAHAAERIVSRVIADGADLVYERYSLFSTALADITAATGVPSPRAAIAKARSSPVLASSGIKMSCHRPSAPPALSRRCAVRSGRLRSRCASRTRWPTGFAVAPPMCRMHRLLPPGSTRFPTA